MGVLSDGRFILGLGSGENLNEHVVGQGWPAVVARQDMLAEAVRIIRELHTGDQTTYDGDYFRVDSARVWDLPEQPVPIALAVSGAQSIARFAPLGDHLIAVQPDAALVEGWDSARADAGPRSSRKIGQIPICWNTDRDAAVATAHETFRWFGGGWHVTADLPMPAGFVGATQFARPDDVADAIACGPDLDVVVESVRPYWEAGFTDIALVQVGDANQQQFLDEAAEPLLTRLRQAAP